MASNKDTFVFYQMWWDAIKGLPKNVRGEVCEGIVRYAFGETEAGLGNMAQMALRFITPQIDRDRERYEAKCEQNRTNASNRKRSLTNANGRNQSQANAVYDNDNDNDCDNDISLSLSPSHEVESRESGDDIGGVSAAEKETFFEILFFRNFKNPEKEVERFINHYSAAGWRRHGDIRAVRDKTALARNWKPENEQTGIGRFQPDILRRLQAAYAEIKAESPEDASAIIHGTHGFDELQDDFRIRCNSKAIMEICERHKTIINNTLTNGKRLLYGVLKQA